MKTNFFLVMALSLLLFLVCETLAKSDKEAEKTTNTTTNTNTTTTNTTAAVPSGQIIYYLPFGSRSSNLLKWLSLLSFSSISAISISALSLSSQLYFLAPT